jgi:hypothetical protein
MTLSIKKMNNFGATTRSQTIGVLTRKQRRERGITRTQELPLHQTRQRRRQPIVDVVEEDSSSDDNDSSSSDEQHNNNNNNNDDHDDDHDYGNVNEDVENVEDAEEMSEENMNVDARGRKFHNYLLIDSKHHKRGTYDLPRIETDVDVNVVNNKILESSKYVMSFFNNEYKDSDGTTFKTNRVERAARQFGKTILRELMKLRNTDIEQFKKYVENGDEVYIRTNNTKQTVTEVNLENGTKVRVSGLPNPICYTSIEYRDVFVQFIRLPNIEKLRKIPSTERDLNANGSFKFYEYNVYGNPNERTIWKDRKQEQQDVFPVKNRYVVKSYFRPFVVEFDAQTKTVYGYDSVDVFHRFYNNEANRNLIEEQTMLTIKELKRELFIQNGTESKHTTSSGNENRRVRELTFGNNEPYDHRKSIRKQNCVKRVIVWNIQNVQNYDPSEILQIHFNTSKDHNINYIKSKLHTASISFYKKLKGSFENFEMEMDYLRDRSVSRRLEFLKTHMKPFIFSEYYKVIAMIVTSMNRRRDLKRLHEEFTRIIMPQEQPNNFEGLYTSIYELIKSCKNIRIIDDFTTNYFKVEQNFYLNDVSSHCEGNGTSAEQYRSFNELKKYSKQSMTTTQTVDEWLSIDYDDSEQRDLLLQMLSHQLYTSFILHKEISRITTNRIEFGNIYNFMEKYYLTIKQINLRGLLKLLKRHRIHYFKVDYRREYIRVSSNVKISFTESDERMEYSVQRLRRN